MDAIRSAFYILTVLSVLVIVHEWGHFIVAKLCKMRVDDFSLFFGKRLIRLGVRNGTEYNIRTIPLGGFVKIAGMEPDDISNGAPIFKRSGSRDESRSPIKVLRGLQEASMADVDFSKVSERIRTAASEAVGDDGCLTDNGRLELKQLTLSPHINTDEHRYLEAILRVEGERPDPDGYNQKPLWQRAAVIFAGPFISLLFGYFIFCVMGFTIGLPDNKHVAIESITQGDPAAKAGLLPGDEIVEINGKQYADLDSLLVPIKKSLHRPVHLVVRRNGALLNITATTKIEMTDEDDGHGKKVKRPEGRLGFRPGPVWRRYSPGEAVARGTKLIYNEVTVTFQGLFGPHVSDNVGGPIAIGSIIVDNSREGPRSVMFTAAMLSVSIGILNLFPIPILDGGHLLMLSIEFLSRRKLSSRTVYVMQMFGLSIIGFVFIWVMYHDIARLLPSK